MKRLICLVLAFVIFFGICGIIAPDINNIYKLKEADSFAEQVNVLVKQYESRQDTQNRLKSGCEYKVGLLARRGSVLQQGESR